MLRFSELDEYVDIFLLVDNICIDVNRCNLIIDCFILIIILNINYNLKKN